MGVDSFAKRQLPQFIQHSSLTHSLKIVQGVFFFAANNFSYHWNTTGITVAGVTGNPGVSNSRLSLPISIVVDASNTLYISEFANNRVQKWLRNASNGTTVSGRSNGISGSGLSYLNGPFGIAVDFEGGIYVADASNNRIVHWANGSSSGTLVAGTGEKP